MIIKILLINILFLLFSGCSTKQAQLNGVEKHTINSSELRLLMNELDMVVYDKYKSELERDDTRRRYALRLAENIKNLSQQINTLSKDKLGKEINRDDSIVFNNYITELKIKGENIHELALNYELENIDKNIKDIERTCNACHKKFRSHP